MANSTSPRASILLSTRIILSSAAPHMDALKAFITGQVAKAYAKRRYEEPIHGIGHDLSMVGKLQEALSGREKRQTTVPKLRATSAASKKTVSQGINLSG